MNNPIQDAEKLLKSQNYKYKISEKSLHFEDSIITVEPSSDSVDCSRATMQMTPLLNRTGFISSFLLFIVVNSVMGKSFDISAFFDKFKVEPFGEFSDVHDGVRVVFTPTKNLWTIDFGPA